MKRDPNVSVGSYITYVMIQELDKFIDIKETLELVPMGTKCDLKLMNVVYDKIKKSMIGDVFNPYPTMSMYSVLLAMLSEIEWNYVYLHMQHHVLYYDEIESYENQR